LFDANPRFAGTTYLAIFDGHGGSEAAEFCMNNLHLEIEKALSSSLPEESMDQAPPEAVAGKIPDEILRESVRTAFRSVDEAFLTMAREKNIKAGTTASVVLSHGGSLLIAWVGDSPIILCDASGRAHPLTASHNADNVLELKRIESANEFDVIVDHRVAGSLAVTRALGAMNHRSFGVISEPEIIMRRIEANDRFITLVTDGVSGVLSSQVGSSKSRGNKGAQ
jgi:serine/threonine protein phosphatase PrpC